MVSHVINALDGSHFGAVLFEMARLRYVPYQTAGEVRLFLFLLKTDSCSSGANKNVSTIFESKANSEMVRP